MCVTKPLVYHSPLQTHVREHINHSLMSQTQTTLTSDQFMVVHMYREEKHLYA